MDNIKTISQNIREQFPSFYEDDTIILFLEAYYEYLENSTLIHLKNTFDYADVDQTLAEFIEYFMTKYVNNFPFKAASDKRFLIKNIIQLYQSKGSEASLKLLMKMLFDEDVEIYYPITDVFKPSDSRWIEPKYIELIHDDQNYQLVGKTIVSSDGGEAFVDNIITKQINGRLIDAVYLTDATEQKFFKNCSISIKDDQLFPSKTVLGSLSSITVSDDQAGALYVVGEEVFVSDGTGSSALGQVTSIKSVSDLANINIKDGGYGFTTDNYTSILISDTVFEVLNPNKSATPLTVCKRTLQEYAINNTVAGLVEGNSVKDDGSLNVGTVVSANNTHIIINPTTASFNDITTIYKTTDVGQTTPYTVTFSQDKSVLGTIVGQSDTRIGVKWNTPSSNLYFNKTNTNTVDLFDKVSTYNYISDSEQFNLWTNTNTTVQQNVGISPLVNNTYMKTVDRLVENSTNSVHKISYPKVTNGYINFSVYAKSSNRSIIIRIGGLTNTFAEFNLVNGTVGATGSCLNATISPESQGWYRIGGTFNGIGITAVDLVMNNGIIHNTGQPAYLGNNTAYVELYGAVLTNTWQPIAYQVAPASSTNQLIFKERINIVDKYLGSGAAFQINSITRTETVNVNSNKLADYQNVHLNSLDYGFQSYPTSLTTVLADALSFVQMDIGTIQSLKNRNPGSGYTSDLFIYVYNPFIVNYQKKDLMLFCDHTFGFVVGETLTCSTGATAVVQQITTNYVVVRNTSFTYDFVVGSTVTGSVSDNLSTITSLQDYKDITMGNNAIIDGTVQRLPGAVTTIKIIDSGYGYLDNSTLTMRSEDNVVTIQGNATVSGIGVQKGYWTTTNSHISTDKKIHDNYYYQEYSFVIKSRNSFNLYKDVIRSAIQLAGTKMFGSTNITSTPSTTSSAISIITS